MSKLSKQEALAKIDELKKYVEDYQEYIPELNETIIVHSPDKHSQGHGVNEGDIGVCIKKDHALYGQFFNPRWDDKGNVRMYFKEIKKLEIDNV